jgi:hypothetical protein
MTTQEFNEKYKDYLEKGHYGLAISGEDFIKWLDEKFQKFIKYPNFKYYQIKSKFGGGRFYCEGIPDELVIEVENKIRSYC